MQTMTGTRMPAATPRNGFMLMRALFAAALLVALAGMSGCTIFRRGPLPQAVPPAFLTSGDVAQLTNPQTYQAAYARLFPTLPKVQTAGRLVGRGRFGQGKEWFDFLFFDIGNPQFAPIETGSTVAVLNLQGMRQQIPLFNIIVRNGQMTVLLHQAQQLFEGPIPPGGTIFGRRLGVEPWDLVSVFSIGQQIATESFTAKQEKTRLELTPTTGTLGGKRLEHIYLDGRTGLPRCAFWRAGNADFEIQYRGWNYFTDSRTGQETRLMPSTVRIIRSHPRVTLDLTLRSYQFNTEVSERMLNPVIPQPYRQYPLEALDKVF